MKSLPSDIRETLLACVAIVLCAACFFCGRQLQKSSDEALLKKLNDRAERTQFQEHFNPDLRCPEALTEPAPVPTAELTTI